MEYKRGRGAATGIGQGAGNPRLLVRLQAPVRGDGLLARRA